MNEADRETFGKGNIVSPSPAVQAIHCHLEEIVPRDGRTWDDSCTDRFISLAHQKAVTVVFVHSGVLMSGLQPEVYESLFYSLSVVAVLPAEADGEPLPILMFESDLNGPKANMAELLVKEGLACLKRGSDEFLICCNMTCHVHLPVAYRSVVYDANLSPQ